MGTEIKMEKQKKLIKICNFVAFIFALSFLLKLARDWGVYSTTLNSAPFYIWVVADAVQYLMPAAFVFLIGRFVKHQQNKENTDAE